MDNSAEIVEMLSPRRLVERVADQAMQLIAGAESVLVGFCEDQAVTYISGAGFLVGHVGMTVDMEESLAGLAIRTRQVLCSNDTQNDPRVDPEKCGRLNVASSACVPLYRGDEILGVLSVSSTQPGAFGSDDIALLTRMADFVGIAVGLAMDLARVGRFLLSSSEDRDSANRFLVSVLRPDAVSLIEMRERVQAVLDHQELLTMTFQPILDTTSGAVVGVEALARFHDGASEPSRRFAEAHAVGLGIELELRAVAQALDTLSQLPQDAYLTINVGPETIGSRAFADTVAGVDATRVVIELTEHRRVADYLVLMETLQRLRSTGARLAIDDTGAGYSSLSHILKLAPDFIKLDRDLVSGIDVDPVRRTLAASLVTFASGTGAEIIAEGVETQDELRTLERLGVHFSQGFLYGSPGCLEELFGTRVVEPHPRPGALHAGTPA